MAICLTSEIFTGIAAHLLAVGLYTSLRTTCLPTPELTTYVQLFPQGQHHANLVWPLEPPPRLARTQSYSPPEDKRFSPTATWKQDYHHPHLLRGSPNRTRRLIGYRWYVQHVIARKRPGGGLTVCRSRTCNAVLKLLFAENFALESSRWHCTIIFKQDEGCFRAIQKPQNETI
jgi:hypothetical protein